MLEVDTSRGLLSCCMFFFFQAEDGIRDDLVTGVQTCALPIFCHPERSEESMRSLAIWPSLPWILRFAQDDKPGLKTLLRTALRKSPLGGGVPEIGRASCRERV